MRERVSVIQGKRPVILVAPHGADDTNTAVIAEQAAKQLDCYAVINRGFERSDTVDVDNDKANCNRIDHAKQEVVYDEFLRPILRIKDKLIQKWYKSNPWYTGNPQDPVACVVFHVHGCGDLIHKEANEPVELVVGYGLGHKKDNLSCELWRKNCFVDIYRHYAQGCHSWVNGEVYEGKGGGKYAGRDSNNMNQYFRKHLNEPFVDSLQLEFPYSSRNTESRAVITAMLLSTVIQDMLQYTSYSVTPDQKLI